ncbi:MAG TPA: hypothetical protein VLG49_02465 [Rhabdochlamydiaceae bacterium]|nr:hypothetical protein [Rhabdochlamydiaceae bacterium]
MTIRNSLNLFNKPVVNNLPGNVQFQSADSKNQISKRKAEVLEQNTHSKIPRIVEQRLVIEVEETYLTPIPEHEIDRLFSSLTSQNQANDVISDVGNFQLGGYALESPRNPSETLDQIINPADPLFKKFSDLEQILKKIPTNKTVTFKGTSFMGMLPRLTLSQRLEFSIAVLKKVRLEDRSHGFSQKRLHEMIPENAFVKNIENPKLEFSFNKENQNVPTFYLQPYHLKNPSDYNYCYLRFNIYTVGQGLETITEGLNISERLNQFIQEMIDFDKPLTLSKTINKLERIQSDFIRIGK